ncbi:hypothetical protein DC58_12500 [Vibrio navarrensis]|uniref:DUF2141 domain-containing protein n=1 Tax=Vibrio navarrensis TaxID=29495 RepID=UPI00052B536B|nr:DUF2141 domain-containing protein [Vibrio navarrensis]KGK21994.1 hypothetical protein DC58_12500 [Vibrio navarrensis]
MFRQGALLLATTVLCACNESTPVSNATHTLTLEVAASQAKGDVYVELYQGETSIETRWLNQAALNQPVVFSDVKQGEYAIMVYQDVDGNHELTMSGPIPQEPLGYSNNPRLMGPPSFALVSFAVKKDSTQKITLLDYRS